MDLSADTNGHNDIDDASVFIYPVSGYGDAQLIRQLIKIEKPDMVMFFTDPRYWTWLFQIENEIRRKVPMVYLNIWDDYPVPMYNEAFYESCDGLMAISKQTLNINKIALGDKVKGKVLSYVPHGINENIFCPVTDEIKLDEVRKNIFGDRKYDFVLMFNSRNIRRKSVPDTLAAFKVFLDMLPKDKAEIKNRMVMQYKASAAGISENKLDGRGKINLAKYFVTIECYDYSVSEDETVNLKDGVKNMMIISSEKEEHLVNWIILTVALYT